MYFTPDGRYAIVVAERLQELDFRNPNTMALIHTLHVPQCAGVDHADFSANGRYMYASCEFAGRMIEVDLKTLQRDPNPHAARRLARCRRTSSSRPTAARSTSPTWTTAAFGRSIPGPSRSSASPRTGAGAHGLYPSRNAKFLYVSNREAGSVSVMSFATNRVVKTWQLPLPASPDMGGVSADGKTLWLSGRYNGVVYAINTSDRQAARDDPGRRRTPRAVRVAATGPPLAGPHGNHALRIGHRGGRPREPVYSSNHCWPAAIFWTV